MNMGGVRQVAVSPSESAEEAARKSPDSASRVVAIASSTGGPRALAEIIPNLPENLGAAVVIVQHMPREFTRLLSDRLGTMSELWVGEAIDGKTLRENRVYVAPGGYHMTVQGEPGNATIRLDTGARLDRSAAAPQPVQRPKFR